MSVSKPDPDAIFEATRSAGETPADPVAGKMPAVPVAGKMPAVQEPPA